MTTLPLCQKYFSLSVQNDMSVYRYHIICVRTPHCLLTVVIIQHKNVFVKYFGQSIDIGHHIYYIEKVARLLQHFGVIVMDRTTYESKVFAICNLIDNVRDNASNQVITKHKVCEIFNIMTSKPDVPGYWMTDAMEKWGKQNNFVLMYTVNKHGRYKNIMLVKA